MAKVIVARDEHKMVDKSHIPFYANCAHCNSTIEFTGYDLTYECEIMQFYYEEVGTDKRYERREYFYATCPCCNDHIYFSAEVHEDINNPGETFKKRERCAYQSDLKADNLSKGIMEYFPDIFLISQLRESFREMENSRFLSETYIIEANENPIVKTLKR